jgi:hypothetical protein
MSRTSPYQAPVNPPNQLRIGDLVKFRAQPAMRGRIVELRGPLGPGGAQVYRLLLRRKPVRAYVEAWEDQLEVVRRAGEESAG